MMYILIPTYDKDGEAIPKIDWNLATLEIQECKDFQVILSDDSENENVYELSKKWKDKLNIRYEPNEYRYGPAKNLNQGLAYCPEGSIVKLICQDDWLGHSNSLDIINTEFTEDVNWLFTQYIHSKDYRTFYKRRVPAMNPEIELVNTLGTPSAMTIRKTKNTPLFDEKLKYFFDADFYRKMYNLYGDPKIIPDVGVVNYIWDKSITSQLTDEEYTKEYYYLKEKYGK